MRLTTTNETTAWNMLENYVANNNICRSVKGKEYQIVLRGDVIYFTGEDRTVGEESISHTQFQEAFRGISHLTIVNTNTIKGLIPTKLYRRRSPFIALLLSSGILSQN